MIETGPTVRSIILNGPNGFFNQPNALIFPELLVSTLIESKMHAGNHPWHKNLIYAASNGWQGPSRGRDQFRIMDPTRSENIERWRDAVKGVFQLPVGNLDYNLLARALATELTGINAERSSRIAVLPVTPATSILQTNDGCVGGNAEQYATIIEQHFSAGAAQYHGSAAGLVIEAMRRRLSKDNVLMGIEKTVRVGLLTTIDPDVSTESGVFVATPRETPQFDPPSYLTSGTPFSWFHESVIKLTNDEWVEALPARRWVDWVATSTRLAIGMGVLWRSRWNAKIGQLIMDDSDDISIHSLIKSMKRDPLITWHESRKPLRSRNVQPDLRRLIAKGAFIDILFENMLKVKTINLGDDFSDTIAHLRQNSRSEFQRGMAQDYLKNPKKNRRDDVETMLVARRTDGPHADHYGLLARHGKGTAKFLIVDPTTEVLALIASLACESPDGECTVGDVRAQLRSLGLEPSIPELVRRLELAGLCRGSADASEAVVVRSAFLGRGK